MFGLRPEACQPRFDSGMINGKVDFVENTGNLKTAALHLADGSVFYLQCSDPSVDLRAVRGFDFAWENVCLFDADTGINLELGGK